MRKKLIGVFLILLAALLLLQGYFVKWDISIWTLAWVTLLAVLSLSSFLKRHFGWGFIYGLLALFCLNKKTKARLASYSAGSMSKSDGNDIDVTFSTVTKYLNDQHFTHGSADVSMGEASVYFDNCRIEGPSAQFVVDVSLGSLSLYVPSDWRVHVNVDNSLSAIQHQENPSALTSKDFYITGDVSLGNLEIIYVGANSFS